MTTICANLIVKNEANVIQRCLDSLAPFVDSFCVVDTGSTDGTQDIIRSYPNAVLFERPWKNFGENRQEALELARPLNNDYILFMDADDILVGPPDFHWPDLTLPGYSLPIHYGGTTYSRCVLVRSDAPWRWEGVVHEFLTSDVPLEQGALTDPHIEVMHDGARSKDPTTYLKDAELLEKAERTPRNVFYLAQSYRDAGEPGEALNTYEERAAMSGWVEETWYAMYEAAKLKETLKFSQFEVTGAYLAAYQFRPTRAEPLFHLARYHRLRGEYVLASMFAREGGGIDLPEDKLFVLKSIYDWQLMEEWALAAYYVGDKVLSEAIFQDLVKEALAPPADIERFKFNLRTYYE